MQFATSHDGVPIAYETYGAGEPALVLIHGWSCDRSYWAGQRSLSRDFQLVALDLAGHGQSGTERQSWTIDSFGQDVAAVVEAVDPGPVVLVGHSMGGNVAVAAARRLGERVEAVIWVDTYRKLGSPRSPREIEQLLAPFRSDFKGTTQAYVRGMFPAGADEELVERVAEAMSAAPPAAAVAALESSLTFGRTITQTLKSIGAPVLAINADQPSNDVPSMQGHGVEVEQISGVGHFLMMEDPQSFNAVLSRLVRKSGRAASS